MTRKKKIENRFQDSKNTKHLQHQTMNDFDAHSQALMPLGKNLHQILQGQVMGDSQECM